MAHTSTPSFLRTRNNSFLPSKYSMKIVLGYSAALRIVKTANAGEIEIILN